MGLLGIGMIKWFRSKFKTKAPKPPKVEIGQIRYSKYIGYIKVIKFRYLPNGCYTAVGKYIKYNSSWGVGHKCDSTYTGQSSCEYPIKEIQMMFPTVVSSRAMKLSLLD